MSQEKVTSQKLSNLHVNSHIFITALWENAALYKVCVNFAGVTALDIPYVSIAGFYADYKS